MKTSSLLIHPTTWITHAVLALVALYSAQAQTYDWNQTATPKNWSDAVNWSTSVPPAGGPSGAGIVVDINTNIAGNTAINLFNTGDSGTAAKTVGILNIGDTNASNTFTLQAGTGSGSLIMDNGGSTAQINQLSTSKGDTISAPIALNGSLDLSNATAANTLTISGGITSNNTGLKTITNGGGGNGKVTLSGIIGDGSSGSVAVTQNSSTSILQLGNTNTFTGGLNINKGTVQLAANSGTGNGLVTIGSSGNSAILDLNGGSRLIIQLAAAGTVANQIIANSSSTVAATMTYYGATNSNFDGIIQDAVNGGNRTTGVTVNKAGANLTLSGANTYTGLTTITTGTLGGIGSHAFGSTSGISIAGTGILSLRGDNTNTPFSKASDSSLYAVTTSASSSTINVNQATVAGTGQTMTIGTLGTSSTAATYQLNFTGANNTSLSVGAVTGAASTAIATSTISNAISGGGSLTLASFTSANTSAGDTLIFTGAGNTTVTGAVTPSSTTLNLQQNGTGVVTLNGTSSYTGVTTIAAGTGILEVANLANGNFNSSIGASSNAASNLLLGNGTTLRYTGGTTSTDRNFTVNGTAAGHSATIQASGSGALTITGAPSWGTTNQTRTLNLGGTNTNLNTLQGVIANNGSSLVSVVKQDGGTWALAGNHTYSGATTVTGGKFVVNGNLASSSLTVGVNATLGGTGTIAGDTTIDGTHNPGNSPGIQSFGGNLTYNAGSSLNWELSSNTTINATNPNAIFDTVVVAGNLSFNGRTDLNLSFKPVGGNVIWSDPFWQTGRTGTNGWLVYDVTGTISGFSNNNILTNLNLVAANWQDSKGNFFDAVLTNSAFFLYQESGKIYLDYTISTVTTPEPSSGVAMAVVAVLAGTVFLLRRRRAQN
jgi:fibronectin-binding autotransporter adhesin